MEAAFVLHRWPYQETSLIVELYSRTQGRMRVIAKGAKRPKSPWRSILQPFVPMTIETRGRHELQTLTHAESISGSLQLRGRQLYSGFYLNELIQRLTTPYQANETLFDDYQETLELLQAVDQVEPLLRRFEWQLLHHSGHAFDWQHDVESGADIQPLKHYNFIPEQGFIESTQGTFSGADLLKLNHFEINDDRLLRLMKQIMRMALQPYLGDQPLRSRALFQGQSKSVKDTTNDS
ncbi:MAG TPA: DNA repair protein RecO [Pseudidiomarina sp.]|nr:DNA repair protein RecO [Pseudidiomarina sp.]